MGFKPWMMIGVKSDYAIDCATAAPYLLTYLPLDSQSNVILIKT